MFLRNKCSVNTNNKDTDRFVGIKCEAGNFHVYFPLGYHLSDEDENIRKDILNLISVINNATNSQLSELNGDAVNSFDVDMPLQSYVYIIKDYFEHGHYREAEVFYDTSRTGRINWGRTIKTQKAHIHNNEVFYLEFSVRKNRVRENELISLIHEFCVFESFRVMGWLFTDYIPPKPKVTLDKELCRMILKNKISQTYNDRSRMLFVNMLNIIEKSGDPDSEINYTYGTYRFEYVWEHIIDKIFGIPGKSDYFPKTYWKIGGKIYENACLEPDTVMLRNNDVFILDAKYYKYGSVAETAVFTLPESSSINKQITYGEYVYSKEEFKKIHGKNFKTYNAFIMPYDSNGCEIIKNIGEAISDWKENNKPYQRIQGILLDVKTVMELCMAHNDALIDKMAFCIECGFKESGYK